VGAIAVLITASGGVGSANVASAATNTAVPRIVSGLFDGDTHCNPSDFKISGLTGTVEYGYLTVVGTVRNNCSEAAAPQLKLTVFDCKGNVLDTDESWPASVRNIGSHSSYVFKLMMSVPENQQKYSVYVMDVRRW